MLINVYKSLECTYLIVEITGWLQPSKGGYIKQKIRQYVLRWTGPELCYLFIYLFTYLFIVNYFIVVQVQLSAFTLTHSRLPQPLFNTNNN